MSDPKLSFVIAGAQKSGTTTLDAIFRRHPEIEMASVKETHFFDDEDRDWTSPDYRALHGLFNSQDGRLRGEATPVTMYWRPAVRRLQVYNPSIRIVLMLRDPVMRAFSNWRHEQFHRRETLPFSEAIREGRARVRDEGTSEGLHRYCSYVERGLYGDQLSYLAAHFPKQNIHCEIYEEFFQDQASGLERIAAFLGIGRFSEETSDLHLNRSQDSHPPSSLAPADIGHLANLFAAQIGMVEDFLGRPLPLWRVHTDR